MKLKRQQGGRNAYDKLHPPIYLSNAKDPRINSYSPAGNQYLYKKPIIKNSKLLIKKKEVIPVNDYKKEIIEDKIIPILKVDNNKNDVLKGKFIEEYTDDPRSKNTVPYNRLNPVTNKEWTPEDYSNYIDAERLKKAKYNEILRKGIIKEQTGGLSELGYSDNSPYQDYPYIPIEGNNITMAQTSKHLTAIPLDEWDNILGIHDLEPYSGEYEFEGANKVLEIPKGQRGVRSPRHVETDEEKALRLSQYTPSNINYYDAYLTDMDMTRSRDVNVPFVNNPVDVKTPSYVATPVNNVVRNNKKPLYKTTVKSNISKTAKDFSRDFTNAELEQQAIENTPISNNDINAKDILGTPIIGKSNTSKRINDSGFIKSNPVTLQYDNSDEARAIQYRRLKGSNVLAPYKGNIQLSTPVQSEESVNPYLANIREQRNAVMQQINPNTSTGQAALAGLYGQSLNQENEAVGQVNRNNIQNNTNWLNQVASTRNQQQQLDYNMNDKYYNDVTQLQALQDENDMNYMDSISNMSAKRLQAKNRFLGTAIETGLPSDALNIGDREITFDVSKIPTNFYSPKSDATSELPQGKMVYVKGIPYQQVTDKNGGISLTPVPINKAQYGGMSKYKMVMKKANR